MENLSTLPPSGGSQNERDNLFDSKSVTRESIISQINQIYNTISNTYSFRVIRQYCKGFKPNILLQTLIRLVSSLQEGLKYYPTESFGQEEETYYFTPIDDFISYINFDFKVQNIKLFCSRMEQGISNFSTIINSKKKSDFLLEINSCYSQLSNACNDLNSNILTSEKICIAINSYEKLREVVNKIILETSSTPTSPIRTRHSRRKKSDDPEIKQIKKLSADEVLNLYSKTNLSFITITSASKDQYWTKQSQSYSENLEKNLHQLLYMFSLKREFDELSASLHILQNVINETNQFPKDDQVLNQESKKKRKKRKKSELENEDQSNIEKVENEITSNFPFKKKPPLTKEIINDVNYVKWAEANLDSTHPRILKSSQSSSLAQKQKKKRKRKSSSKSKDTRNNCDNENDEDFEEFAKIVPAKSISQRHMRPYETINLLEFENKKLEDLIRQCPHKPEEVKQLREENADLTQQVRSLTHQLDELESMLLDEEEKFYE